MDLHSNLAEILKQAATVIRLNIMSHTLNILAQAIRDGLTNSDLAFYPTGAESTFKNFIGRDLSVSGKHSIDDEVPAGLFIWGENNFIGSPDTVFTNYSNKLKVAFYAL